jgi:hypothetical protein
MKTIFCASLVHFTVRPREIASETDTHYIPTEGLRFLKKSPVSSYFDNETDAYEFLLKKRRELRAVRLRQFTEIQEDINRLLELQSQIKSQYK